MSSAKTILVRLLLCVQTLRKCVGYWQSMARVSVCMAQCVLGAAQVGRLAACHGLSERVAQCMPPLQLGD